MFCTCAYVVCWSVSGGLATGRVFKCLGLGDRWGPGGTVSSVWWGYENSLEEGISPAFRLVGTALFSFFKKVYGILQILSWVCLFPLEFKFNKLCVCICVCSYFNIFLENWHHIYNSALSSGSVNFLYPEFWVIELLFHHSMLSQAVLTSMSPKNISKKLLFLLSYR